MPSKRKTQKEGHTKKRGGTNSRKRSLSSRITPVSKKTKIEPVFIPTQGEGVVEANLSFLIELIGGSIYNTYVEFLNEQFTDETIITVKDVKKPMNPVNPDTGLSFLLERKPMIFYGASSGTHFTCTTGDGKLIDPYKIGIQIDGTDHFCQTFSLMYMEHHFFPESVIGKLYEKISFNGTKEGYLNNVMLAIQSACYVIEKTKQEFDSDHIKHFLQIALNSKERGEEESRHKTNVPESKIIINLLKYCRQLTKEQVFESSFIEKIFDLSSPKSADTFRNNNRSIIE